MLRYAKLEAAFASKIKSRMLAKVANCRCKYSYSINLPIKGEDVYTLYLVSSKPAQLVNVYKLYKLT